MENGLMWDKERESVTSLIDRLGTPIDPEIIEVVIGLRLLGITTTASCSGHPDRVTGGPYVMFSHPKAAPVEASLRGLPRSSIEYKASDEEARLLNLNERLRLVRALDDFYRTRSVPYLDRIVIMRVGSEGSRLACQGAAVAHQLNDADRGILLQGHQKEMSDFGRHLRRAWTCQVE